MTAMIVCIFEHVQWRWELNDRPGAIIIHPGVSSSRVTKPTMLTAWLGATVVSLTENDSNGGKITV
jgi:hypothetical protein